MNCYVAAQEPALQIVDYYFASQTPYFNFYHSVENYTSNDPAPPFPGSPSPLIILTAPSL